MNPDVIKLKQFIKDAKHIVFLTGAGISKPSGIPDIRGNDGLAKRESNNKKYGATYEEIVSHEYFMYETEKFYKYYFNEMIFKDAKPNAAHLAIARLNNKATVITQNIDGLHTLAGSKNVIEIHGSVNKNRCLNCNEFFDLNSMLKLAPFPKCPKCGGIIKPEVVLFSEPLNEQDLEDSLAAVSSADLMICIGSSLVVNPAASLPYYFNGANLVIINKDPTPYDDRANIVIHDDIINFIDFIIEK